MSENRDQSREAIRGQLLSNPAVIRLIRGFETFQQVFGSAETDEEKDVVLTRMREIYPKKEISTEVDEETKKVDEDLDSFFETIFEKVGKGTKITPEFFVDELFKFSKLPETLLKYQGFKPELSRLNKREMYINDIISVTREEGDSLVINLRATKVNDLEELVGAVKDAFSELAKYLSNKSFGISFSKTREIKMTSWLLGPAFADKIKEVFGSEDISFQEPVDEEDVMYSQQLALIYNKQSLGNFLKAGKKPVVRELVISKEEFIKRFGK